MRDREILAGLLFLPMALMAQEPGDLDNAFGVEGRVITDFAANDLGRAIALQPDGRIVVAGSSGPLIDDNENLRSGAKFAVARYLPDGTLDTTFGGDGRVTTAFEQVASGNQGPAQAVALQPDGRIVAAGYIPSSSGVDFALARYLPDGALDASFGGDGKVTTDISALLGLPAANARASAVVLQPDGRIVAIGGNFFVRYLADGSLDASFGDAGLTAIAQRPLEGAFELFAAALQPDGKMVAVGLVFNFNPPFVNSFVLARVLSDGTFDPSFGIDGLVKTDVALNASLAAVALQPDGKIVAAGRTVEDTGDPSTLTSNFTVARYLSDGMLDATFGGGGLATTDFGGTSQAWGVTLQPDGKIVAAGDAVAGLQSQGNDFALARYLADGSADTAFGGDGQVTTDFAEAGRRTVAFGLVIQPDGRLVAAGTALTSTGDFADFDFALARYESGLVPGRGPPTDKEECKHGGWQTFDLPRDFRNQGDCIQFVNTRR